MSGISTEDTPLAGYQERRLIELTAAVDAKTEKGARASAFDPPHRPGVFRRRSTWGVAGAACATFAVTGGLLTWTGEAQHAYAVTRDPSGLVTVKVTEETLDSRDADALSHELRSLGVPALVYSIPEGKVCPQPYAKLVDLPPNVYDMPDGLYTVPSNLPRPDSGWKMTINPRNFKRGQFMVWTLSTSGEYDQNGRRTGTSTSVGTYLASGRTIPCQYQPAPKEEPPQLPPDMGGGTVIADTGGYITFANSE
ncbi:hypothetical protein OHR68_39555 [Spirillospora sp. NBC_00431]